VIAREQEVQIGLGFSEYSSMQFLLSGEKAKKENYRKKRAGIGTIDRAQLAEWPTQTSGVSGLNATCKFALFLFRHLCEKHEKHLLLHLSNCSSRF